MSDWKPAHGGREKTELYCPNCGKKNLDLLLGTDDYYVGDMYHCRSCDHELHLPDGGGSAECSYCEPEDATPRPELKLSDNTIWTVEVNGEKVVGLWSEEALRIFMGK